MCEIASKKNIHERKVFLEVETRERETTTMHWRPAYLYPKVDGVSHIWKEPLTP